MAGPIPDLLPDPPPIIDYIDPLPVLPPYPAIPPSLTDPDDLTGLAAADRVLTIAGEGSVIPILYGRQQVGPLITLAYAKNEKLYLQLVWCLGEVEEIESIVVNNEDVSEFDNISMTHYTGTTGQGIDSTLAAIVPGYADNLVVTTPEGTVGVCYSVAVIISSDQLTGFPSFKAMIKGLKVYDPRGPSTAYSDNPALCLADFLASPTYGMGLARDDTSVGDVADDCDEIISGEKRRTIGLAIQTVDPVHRIVETLRTYANAFVVMRGGTFLFVSDNPVASAGAIVESNIVSGTFNMAKKNLLDTPTVMRVNYSEEKDGGFVDGYAEAALPGVATGDVQRRVQSVRLPGIVRFSHARRVAIERLNASTLLDLTGEFITFDDSFKYEIGDVVDVTHSYGIAAKPVRLLEPFNDQQGRFGWRFLEYQPNVQSDVVETRPAIADTHLPSPLHPPSITGVSVVEEVFQTENGYYSSRLRVDWDDFSAIYPYLLHYEVQIHTGATLIWAGTSEKDTSSFVTGTVQEGVSYTAKVRLVSIALATSATWASNSVTALGKLLPPGDVGGITVFEIGSTVYARVTIPAIDIDVERYEWRWALVSAGDPWEDATLIDRVDTLRIQVDDLPPGDIRIYCKALDSVKSDANPYGQPSINAITFDVAVSSDNVFFIGEHIFSGSDNANNLNVRKYFFRLKLAGAAYYCTDKGETISPTATPPVGAPLINEHTSFQSILYSTEWDHGLSITGFIQVEDNLLITEGTPQVNIQTSIEASPSADDTDWTDHIDATAFLETFRHIRIKIIGADDTETFIAEPNFLTMRVDAVTTEENGTASATNGGDRTVMIVRRDAGHYIKVTHNDAAAHANFMAGIAYRHFKPSFIEGDSRYDCFLIRKADGFNFGFDATSGEMFTQLWDSSAAVFRMWRSGYVPEKNGVNIQMEHEYAFGWDNTANEVKFYIDGVLVATNTTGTDTGNNIGTSSPFLIGQNDSWLEGEASLPGTITFNNSDNDGTTNTDADINEWTTSLNWNPAAGPGGVDRKIVVIAAWWVNGSVSLPNFNAQINIDSAGYTAMVRDETDKNNYFSGANRTSGIAIFYYDLDPDTDPADVDFRVQQTSVNNMDINIRGFIVDGVVPGPNAEKSEHNYENTTQGNTTITLEEGALVMSIASNYSTWNPTWDQGSIMSAGSVGNCYWSSSYDLMNSGDGAYGLSMASNEYGYMMSVRWSPGSQSLGTTKQGGADGVLRRAWACGGEYAAGDVDDFFDGDFSAISPSTDLMMRVDFDEGSGTPADDSAQGNTVTLEKYDANYDDPKWIVQKYAEIIPLTVNLDSFFTALDDVSAQVVDGAGEDLTAVIDNIVIGVDPTQNSFDLYVINEQFEQRAATVYWSIKGV